ncbi:hypothetical protein JCM10908_000936 [Rhodotorula pacifica]|uniref:uncharacterized protein n=1 Tax=Rhodotorula pacifica TaxID=1495444 RepID=UPI0031815A1E
MPKVKSSPASARKAAEALGPIPPYAPWSEFRLREDARLKKEHPTMNTKQRRKRLSKLYAAAKAEKENEEEGEQSSS